MTKENKLTTVDTQTGEILNTSNVIEETENYVITQLPNGKFNKQMKYKKIYTKIPKTTDDQKLMYRVFSEENNDDIVTGLRNMIGEQISIDQFYTNPYSSFKEETGENENGVVTVIQDGESFYATSSKSVYYTILNLVDVFGMPNSPDYEPIKVEVTATKRTNGTQINLSLI